MFENNTNNNVNGNNENKTKVDNTKKREFLLNQNVTASSVEPIIKGIFEINKFDDEQQEKDSEYIREPIKIIIDSYGGSIYCGNALIGVIDASETPIHTYCYGKAMSMGLMIYASGHKRFAHPLACFMYHDGGTSIGDTIEGLQQSVDQLKLLVEHGDEYLLSTTNLSRRKLDEVKKFKQNWYMFTNEAFNYGVVDEIIESRRNRN